MSGYLITIYIRDENVPFYLDLKKKGFNFSRWFNEKLTELKEADSDA